MHAEVIAVAECDTHRFSKPAYSSIKLVAGLGVDGDAHQGELNSNGFSVAPGDMGENVTTRGVDLLSLPVGTRLRLGNEAVVELPSQPHRRLAPV